MYSVRTLPYLALVSVAALLALLVVACGGDEEEATPEPTAAPATEAAATEAPIPDEAVELHIGVVLPETGALGFLNPPMIESVRLAVADILEAGGAIKVTYADTGTNPDVATESVNRLLGEGAHVIVGAAASGISQSFIQRLYDEKIPQCSPSNTSPSFSTQENAGYYFRTVPPDEAVAPIIADEVVADGGTRVAILARADDYGNALANLMVHALNELGAESTIISFDPGASSFESEVTATRAYGPDAIVHISFEEGVSIIRGLLEAGFGPETQYAADGLFFPTLWELIDPNDPNVLDGMKLIGASGSREFNERLGTITGGNLIYGGQSYDCVVLLVLASEAAGSTDGDAIIEALATLTDGGTECRSYADCSALLAEGENIDYVGVSGPLNLDEVGDPTVGNYAIAQFQDGVLVAVGDKESHLGDLVAAAAPAPTEAAPASPSLHIGVILPETGALGEYGVPMIASVRLAIEDIIAGGGNVEVTYADSGTDPDVAGESVNRLLGEGAHVIVGAAASGISQSFIQKLYDERIPQCSPSNTSPSFTGQANAGYYFRTAPSDAIVAPVIADTIVSEGGTRVAILARADDYGVALRDLVDSALQSVGAETSITTYDPNSTVFSAEVEAVKSYGPDAILLISFIPDGSSLVRGLLEAGFSPGMMYGSDGMHTPTLWESVDASSPEVLDGLTLFVATGPAIPAYEEFNARLAEVSEGNFVFGAQSYDCTVILALASRAAGSTDGDDIIAAVSAVTRDGTECTTYGECAALIDSGQDVAYVGKVGSLKLDDGGDPTVATYKVSRFEGSDLVEQITVFDLSR
ncbi:MAG: ABC transporter substrate-binding protein [Chloroflexota bacterium]|nr:ABC transporter substrate-binding protein [Chloroflexota bacterium]